MNYFDEELESIASSIENNLKKIYILTIFIDVLLIFGMTILIYVGFIKYPNETPPMPVTIFTLLSVVIPLVGFTFLNDYRLINTIIFKNMEEEIFFYLFCSWKYHHDKKSKKYLKKCMEKLDAYIARYKNLAYTEPIYSTFYDLHDVLKYHIYSKLGERGDIKNKGDLKLQASAWDDFKSLSLDFYQKSPINSIDEKVTSLANNFKREENVEIATDYLFIKFLNGAFNWNLNMYKNSVTYRFAFYLICTVIIDYYLISNNLVTNDILIPATVLVPIMAPYYLAPQKYDQ